MNCMKRLVAILSCLFCLVLNVGAQNIFEMDGITYSVIRDAGESSTFGTVKVIGSESGFYEGEISIPNGVKNSADQYADSYKVVAIADGAFKDCISLTKVTIPASVEIIGANVFENCAALETVEFKTGNLKSIGREAFKNSGLRKINLPEGLTELPWIAFFGCKQLLEVTLPSTLKSIGYSAFSGCESLREITLPQGLRELMGNCFGGSGIEKIAFPAKITTIPDSCCSWCENLREISFSPNTHTIGDSSFCGCCALADVDFPDNLKKIGSLAFYGCQSLEKVKFPEGIKYVSENAFLECKNIKEITGLPPTIKLNLSK